jgi:sugar/nucleoside kinase (ribokinase family)
VPEEGLVTVKVACVGDIMLDVIVSTVHPLATDDDTPAAIAFAAGGQAANVASWVAALGGEAVVFGPRGPGAGRIAVAALADRGVSVVGPEVRRSGAVVAIVTGGTRSLASDGGSTSWLDEVAPGEWLDGSDWLFVSGYALLRATRTGPLVALAEGRHVAVDLSSTRMIGDYGPDRFRELWQAMRPAVVFANDDEWSACGGDFEGLLVRKHGAKGATFGDEHRPALPVQVVDVTGAGDSLAAGWFVGGPDLAMRTAALCITQVGAQPLQ